MLQVHIEQGPVLESAGIPLGVVKGIAGQTRLKVHVPCYLLKFGKVLIPCQCIKRSMVHKGDGGSRHKAYM